MELVLWIPVFLFVTALIVNFGTAAAWRIRGEIVSRDAVWRILHPRNGGADSLPNVNTWPREETGYTAGAESQQIERLDAPEINYPVVRGPIPGGFDVYQTLDPDAWGMLRGDSHIERTYPWFAKLGRYRSGQITHLILDSVWTIGYMYGRREIPKPNYRSGPPNFSRRTLMLYLFPSLSGGSEYLSSIRSIQSMFDRVGIKVLDRDEEVVYYSGNQGGRGGYVDFHPRPNRFCELLDAITARERALERVMLDYRDARGNVRLGGITRLPIRLTDYWISMYQREIDRLETLIELNGDPGGSLRREIDTVERKKAPVDEYKERLNTLMQSVYQSATVP